MGKSPHNGEIMTQLTSNWPKSTGAVLVFGSKGSYSTNEAKDLSALFILVVIARKKKMDPGSPFTLVRRLSRTTISAVITTQGEEGA